MKITIISACILILIIILIISFIIKLTKKYKGWRSIDKLREYTQKYKQITWVILLSYITINACCLFSFANELFPFNYEKYLTVAIGYGIIGILFICVLDSGKSLIVFILTLCFSIIGMILRYFLEYGEVSSTISFTSINITLFLITIPIYCVIVYWLMYNKHSV